MAMIECREEDVPKVVLVGGIVLVTLITAMAWTKVRTDAHKPVAPITINVTVAKPEQVKPTIEALSKALPKLEERK